MSDFDSASPAPNSPKFQNDEDKDQTEFSTPDKVHEWNQSQLNDFSKATGNKN